MKNVTRSCVALKRFLMCRSTTRADALTEMMSTVPPGYSLEGYGAKGLAVGNHATTGEEANMDIAGPWHFSFKLFGDSDASLLNRCTGCGKTIVHRSRSLTTSSLH